MNNIHSFEVQCHLEFNDYLNTRISGGNKMIGNRSSGFYHDDNPLKDYDYQEVENEATNQCYYSLDKKIEIINFRNSGKNGRLSFSSVKNRYKKVSSESQLNRWEKQIKNGGTQQDKYKMIDNFTLNKFIESRAKNLIIHDLNLKVWSLEFANSIQFDSFKASDKWLHNFKKRNNIVSRKITKFVSLHFDVQEEEKNKIAMEFVQKAKVLCNDYDDDNIFNADQSGFTKELHSGRTLDIKG